MVAIKSLTALFLVGLSNLASPLVSAQTVPDNPDCPVKTSGNCTLTFTTNYWPGDGLFHLDAAVYDKNCEQMDKAKYIYKATKLKGSLPYTLHMHNFTKNENSIEVVVEYNGKLITHPGTNCTHKPDDHLTICPMQFKC